MHRSDRLAWPLIAAAALTAMVSAHALELWLEGSRMFGDGRANYKHTAQTFAIGAAAALLVIVIACIVRRLVRGALRVNDADRLAPALDAIGRLGPVRTGIALLALQFSALVSIELLEQRWSGFQGGVAAIVGPGHATAVAVHAVVGLLFAFLLYRASGLVNAHTRVIVGAIATFLRRVAPQHQTPTARQSFVHLWASDRKPPLLALGLANRPPPATSANAA